MPPAFRGGGQTLAAHSYIINESEKTVFLYSSASNFRTLDKEQRKVVGYANRYLTFKDMLYFKELGYKYYDLGCIGFEEQYNQKDPSIWPIVLFKSGFGGEMVKYYLYTPSSKMLKSLCKILLKLNLCNKKKL